MPWEMLNSEAYKDLAPSAAKALPFFMGKVKCGNKTGLIYGSSAYYETQFRYSYAESKRQGFSNGTFSNVIQEITRKGFVDPVFRGGRKSDGLGYSWFKLSDRWRDFGKENFKIVEWKTLIPKPRTKRKGHAYPFHSPEDLKSTSNSEINNTDFRNRQTLRRVTISENDVVVAKNT